MPESERERSLRDSLAACFLYGRGTCPQQRAETATNSAASAKERRLPGARSTSEVMTQALEELATWKCQQHARIQTALGRGSQMAPFQPEVMLCTVTLGADHQPQHKSLKRHFMPCLAQPL